MDDDFINIDLEGVKSPFSAWPEGVHLVRVTSVVKKQAAGKPHPYLEVQFTSDDEGCTGRAYGIFTLHPEYLWNTKVLCEKTGVQFDSRGFRFMDLKDKSLRITTGQEPAQNDASQMRTVVKLPFHVA